MTLSIIDFSIAHRPVLDPEFLPAVLWNRHYQALCQANSSSVPFHVNLERPDGSRTAWSTRILPWDDPSMRDHTSTYLERALKFLFWQRGGQTIHLGGCPEAGRLLESIYSSSGARSFDHEFMGKKVYGKPLEFVIHDSADDVPDARENIIALGRHLDGCRIGFDLGGSDRKCAAVLEGEPVFTEEVPWDPYFETDPEYHIAGIQDSLNRAASHLPRVDAIGGSSAGVYVNNEVRVASLFRGVSPEDFESKVRHIFPDLKARWDGIPFEVVNDGEVTALAGSMSMQTNAVLGVAMGTSEAVGYVTPGGHITSWINELAFAPIDYRENAPIDEWSGDRGCGVQYFSQQAVARLTPAAGIDLPADMPAPEKLVAVQGLMKDGDERARKLFDTIGVSFGYAIAHYADYYDIENLLVLGRVTSGEGGERILEMADLVLKDEFPELSEKLRLRTPNEQDKRHGQAVAAASLPALEG